jgi:hypothetical protein
MNLGHPAYLRLKGTGDQHMPEKRGQGESANQTPRKTRVVWSKLYCLKSSSGRGILNPIAKLTKRDVTTCQRISGFPLQTRMVRHRERHLGSRNERTT